MEQQRMILKKIEYNSKNIEENHYRLLFISIFISYCLFIPLKFEKYIIINAFISAILFKVTYLNLRSKTLILLICTLTDILDSGILGFSQMKYMIIQYMTKYFSTNFKIQKFIVMLYTVIMISLTCQGLECFLQNKFLFNLNYDQCLLKISYTIIFSIILIAKFCSMRLKNTQ